ncbi:MAG TPA: hypothetical protein VGC13_03620 [Longimicrobium sp.]|jgi:hypothetical protein|uniref:hypothetical protein n=1 Tax=Longimicrobium sp. TaxID=2029185 RepID=UPI002EDB3793
MIRSFSFIRRGFLGIAFAGALGFGATQALASPRTAAGPDGPDYCPIDFVNGPYYSEYCGRGCAEEIGYCSMEGRCVCGYF